jgi:tripartite-type tricarboxylate transporter receptor subunit TctC
VPDLPTLDEAGLKATRSLRGSGSSRPRRRRSRSSRGLNEALNKTTQDPQVRKALEGSGATVIQGTPDAFRDFVKAQTVMWAPIVKRANIVPE